MRLPLAIAASAMLVVTSCAQQSPGPDSRAGSAGVGVGQVDAQVGPSGRTDVRSAAAPVDASRSSGLARDVDVRLGGGPLVSASRDDDVVTTRTDTVVTTDDDRAGRDVLQGSPSARGAHAVAGGGQSAGSGSSQVTTNDSAVLVTLISDMRLARIEEANQSRQASERLAESIEASTQRQSRALVDAQWMQITFGAIALIVVMGGFAATFQRLAVLPSKTGESVGAVINGKLRDAIATARGGAPK